jgi:hypothetical protein
VGFQRRSAAVAAAARAPARWAHGVDNKRPWEVPRVLGGVLGVQVAMGTAGGGGGNGATSSGETAVRRGWKGKTAAFYNAQARG